MERVNELPAPSPTSRISVRDILVFVTLAAVTTTLFISYPRWATIALLATIYICGWRLLNVNVNPIGKIMMLLVAIALLSPLLLWSSSPESRQFNQRIGYGWGGSYLYPYFAVLPVPILTFAWKCFRPNQTVLRYALESTCECFVLIPLYVLFIVGI